MTSTLGMTTAVHREHLCDNNFIVKGVYECTSLISHTRQGR